MVAFSVLAAGKYHKNGCFSWPRGIRLGIHRLNHMGHVLLCPLRSTPSIGSTVIKIKFFFFEKQAVFCLPAISKYL